MRKLALTGGLLLGCLHGLQGVSFAHGGHFGGTGGGQYRGPGDTVPSGPRAPTGPGPRGSGAGSARPASAGGQRVGPTAAGTSTSLATTRQNADLTQWSVWWEFNRHPYLDLKSAIHSTVMTGSEGWFLGRGQQSQARDSLAPTEEDIRQKIVPALIEAIESETNNDIVTGCLIALAKIGASAHASASPTEDELQAILVRELSNPVQEIAETATVSLGILAVDDAVPTLAALLADTPEGRKLVGAREVNYRTRAFAAYGMGLIGAATESEAVRAAIVGHLHRMLESGETKSFDLGAACIVAMGLVPLETIDAESDDLPLGSRRAQLDFLLAYLLDEDNKYMIRAHAPTALVRLVRGARSGDAELATDLPPELYAAYKERIVTELLGLLSKSQNEIVESCVLALGLLGDLDAEALDAEVREAIAQVPKRISDHQARGFAMIAMAKLAGDPGSGDVQKGLAEASGFLLRQVAHGKSTVRPWAGLAIGVMCDELAKTHTDEALVSELKETLRRALLDETDDQRVGAYAIGCGIAADQEATPILRDKLERLRADGARGYVAVSLGLLNDREAIEPIQEIVRESKYRPELLEKAAIGLGLLGDKSIVDSLIDMLAEARGLSAQASICSALGIIGDRRSIDPLIEMLHDERMTATARAFAAVALGIVADKESLPWNSKIAVDLNYRAATQTLNDPAGTGILNIL